MIGITETGDAGLNFSWENKLNMVDFAIIISKNLNDKLINKLIAHQHKIIFHLTCTGYGGTILEPKVPDLIETFVQCNKLITAGFPVEQIVLRIDPIIPTNKGINVADTVLQAFINTGIRRVRYSFLDMYPHIIQRFDKANLPNPYGGNNFFPSPIQIKNALALLTIYKHAYVFESCAESTQDKRGCVSQRDANLLSIDVYVPPPSFKQRKTCLCPNKLQLLKFVGRCPHQCLYCFWK